MSCESKFDGDVSVSCLLELVADVRKGLSVEVLLKAMWLLGCLVAKVSAPKSGVDYSAMSEGVDFDCLTCDSNCSDLESVLCAIETKCYERESSVQSSGPPVGSQGWEVFIPIILELIKMIIENRRKNQQPTPAV